MSDTSATIEWHLTANGWVQGSTTEYFARVAVVKDAPPDRLETYVADYESDSQYNTPVGVTARRTWSHPRLTEQERAEVWRRFPPPWNHFGSWQHVER